ncbi:restriction endonuclease subunit S [bacterium]|nr:restriction endonuclease subunit S [bacterium]
MVECFTVYREEIKARLDSYYYRPEFRELEANLIKCKHAKLGEVIEFSNETWNQKDFFDNEFPYIEISEIDITSGEIQNITYYNNSEAPSRAKMIVRENDIIVSTTRPNRGAIALIDKEKDGFIASTGFAILRTLKTNIDRKYLLYFLRTRLSLKQMLQRSSGGNYPAITSEELKRVIVPVPSKEIQNKIVQIMGKAYLSQKSKGTEAQQLLDSLNGYVLDELGIKFSEIEEDKIYCINSEELENSRYDPYYFNPKFKRLLADLEKSKIKLVPLREVATELFNGKTPAKEDYAEEGNFILKVSCLKSNKIAWDKLSFVKDIVPLVKTVKDKDILLLSSAHQSDYLGKKPSIVEMPNTLKNEKIYFVGELINIRPNIEKVNPYYLLAILKLNEYYLLVNREKRGQTSHLYPNDLGNVKIPLPPFAIQSKIAEEVKKRIHQAEQLQKEAKEGLEKAKKEVEKLILGENR